MTVAAIPPAGVTPGVGRLWSPVPEASVQMALVAPAMASPSAAPPAPAGESFAQLLTGAIDKASTNVTNADNMVRAFVLDDSVPVHQVTFALEQARLSMELMLQVRGRMVEAYQQLMNMQL